MAVAVALLCVAWRVESAAAPPTDITAQAGERPNVLLICVDDLRPELNCYGVDYIDSPNIDALAAAGRRYSRHFVHAPTCGASRFAMLTGRYGTANNDALFRRGRDLKAGKKIPPSMPAVFRAAGYRTVSVGKVSHHPGGRGGKDWNDSDKLEMPDSWDRHLCPTGPWKHPRGVMHGLANGEIRVHRGDMDVFQSVAGDDSIYPDGLITATAIEQLETLAADTERPFFLAVGIIRPHLPFGAPAKYLARYADVELPPIPHPEKPPWKSTAHGSGEFMSYNRWGRNPNKDAEFADQVRRHYAACVSYADAGVGRLMDQLRSTGADQNTIVVLWGDHGWHLGERSIWGKHALFEESLASPLIIRAHRGDLRRSVDDRIARSVDIFPTLCDLAGLEIPEFCAGVSLAAPPPPADQQFSIAYRSNARTIRSHRYRMVLHRQGDVELYDFGAGADASLNVAEQNPDVVARLVRHLDRLRPAE